jgi:hypothetical protein
MRNSAIILTALLAAMPTLAAAKICEFEMEMGDNAEIPQRLPLKQCLKVKLPTNRHAADPTYVKYADTTHCFLRIDGKTIINRMCHVNISQQVRVWEIDKIANLVMRYRYCDNVPDELRHSLYASFQRNGKWLNYGRVKAADNNRQEHICFGNKRFRMCFSQPYLICDPERVKREQAN